MVIGYKGKPYPVFYLIWPYYLGEVDDEINFTFDDNTEVDRSCAATLNDEMWILGGYHKIRQVSFFYNCKNIHDYLINIVLDEQGTRLQIN